MRLLDEQEFARLGEKSPDVLVALTPLNAREEYKKWLASNDKTYNPQFVYDEKVIQKTLKDTKQLIMPLARLAKEYMQRDDWQAELTTDLLVSQVEDLMATETILRAFLSRKKVKAEEFDKAVYRLFGRATNHELDLLESYVYGRDINHLVANLIDDNEAKDFSKAKLAEITTGFLRNLEGILTEDEEEILSEKYVTTEQTLKVFSESIRYLASYSTLDEMRITLCLNERAYHFGVAPRSIELDEFIVDIPKEGVYADYLLQAVAHEINSHLRVMINSSRLQRKISPYFRPTIVTRTQRALAQEGFATLNGEACLGQALCGWFEPLIFLAPYYTKEEHNFAETVKFVYELFDIDPNSDDIMLHHDIWTMMRFFFGTADTSRHDVLVLPSDQVYLLGVFRVLKELARVDGEQFEEPLSLMRYSELPLEFIPKINRLEKQLGQKLTSDPFEKWDFANLKPEVMTPTEYCKHLLLEL